MLLTKYIDIKITGYNIKYYKSKGYPSISKGDIITIPVGDLYENALNIVDVQCDYCGETFQKKYADYVVSQKKIVPKDKKVSDGLLLKIKEKAFDILLNSNYNVYTYNVCTNEEQYR